jgi:hypothetical protein
MKKIFYIILGIAIVIILVLILSNKINKNIETKKIDTSIIPSPTVYIFTKEDKDFYSSDYPVLNGNPNTPGTTVPGYMNPHQRSVMYPTDPPK